jgi:Ca-activated chloride channel family protein
MKRLLCGIVLLQMLGCLTASAVGFVTVDPDSEAARTIIPPRPPHWPPPDWPPPWRHWRPQPYAFAPIQVVSIDVKTKINDQVAVTTIEQEFHNPNAARMEGTFICPLPKGAQINKFTMEIDGKTCEAELLTAEKARGIYEDIVRRAKDPALLEYAGRDMVRVRIFPFEPHGKRRIALKYTELLKSDDGLVSYALPLSAEKVSSSPVSNVTVKVELASRRPIKSIYSPSHSVSVKRETPRRATAELKSEIGTPPADFVLYFASEEKEIGMSLLTHREAGEDGYFLFMASPGLDVQENQVVAKDVIFVVDTSGSMAGKKLEQARKALAFCIENLNDRDSFELIRFSTEVEPLFDKLVLANKGNRAKALKFTEGLRPMGGTAIDDALRKALVISEGKSSSNDRPSVIIFLTDGRPTIGETAEDEIVKNVRKENSRKQRVFCFGIGTDVNTHLIDRITEQTRAVSQYVLPEEDLELKVSSFYSKIKEPVLANPELKVTGQSRVSKMYPSTLPDLFKGDQLVLVGRYSGEGDAAFNLSGMVNGSEKEFTFEGRFRAKSARHDFLPRLWATRRVGYLLDEIRLRGENSELREEVTELARRYGIVTPYTSYLIVEDEMKRGVSEESRLMPRLHNDSDARQAGRQLWGEFGTSAGGLAGTAAARETYSYKSADAPAAAAASGSIEAYRSLGVPARPQSGRSEQQADKGKLRLAQYSQQAQFVAGKTFFQNNGEWVDSLVQKNPEAKVVQLKFGSEEYFKFSREHPEAGPWLGLGTKVRFVSGNVIYSIQN